MKELQNKENEDWIEIKIWKQRKLEGKFSTQSKEYVSTDKAKQRRKILPCSSSVILNHQIMQLLANFHGTYSSSTIRTFLSPAFFWKVHSQFDTRQVLADDAPKVGS